MHHLSSNLGIDSKARTILSLLEDYQPSFARYNERAKAFEVCFQTRAFYEGDSGWIAVVMYPQMVPRGNCKVVVFGEDFNSDQVQVQDWKILDLHGEAPRADHPDRDFDPYYFRPQDIHMAVGTIKKLLREAYEDMQSAEGPTTLLETILEEG